jgi:serine/threonine protein kinase
LRKSGLIHRDELSQFLSGVSWDDMRQSGDSSSLARALIHQQKLTPFQARLLLRGRWQGLVLGNYAILDKLGQGGMGSVFKARHIRMARIVCLKVVNAAGRQSPEVIDRFRNEARALAALSHPNIVVAHDANEAKGIPYLVMEFIDGQDLAKRVRSGGPLSVAETLEIGIQTAHALWYAHGQGVVHRDIKPHNLVATTDEATGKTSLKVLDLGLARFDTLMTDNPDASVLAAMTNTGVVIGTVDYMAPEQALDSRNADARSDIYSLGCTLFFLLTGRPPFSGETVMQRLVAHREQDSPNLSILVDGVSAELDAVIQKMLAKHARDRYQTMDQVLSDLQAVAEGKTPTAPVPPAAPHSSQTNPSSVSDSKLTADGSSVMIQVADDDSLLHRRSKNRFPIEFGRRARLAAGTAAAAALIFSATYFLMPEVEPIDVSTAMPPPPRTGAAQAIRNGGNGRALVLVSSQKFEPDEFQSLARTLGSRNVDMVAASSKYGSGEDEFGSDIKSPYLNLNLTDADATEYDAVFILGGACTELTHKVPEVNKEVKRIVEAALQNDIVLTGCREGFHVMKDTGLIYDERYKHKPLKYEVGNAKDLAERAKKIFDELKTPREPRSPSET